MENASLTNRSLCIDALRGLALFGILAVNIQSFVWGLSGPTLGVLNTDSTSSDHATVFFTALLLEYKAYPIFCFCFGYGFAMQTQRWLSTGENAASRFAGRLRVMLLLGAAHGIFLYFGDILSRYALTGFILRRHIGKNSRALWQAVKFWLVVAMVSALLSAFLVALASTAESEPNQLATQQMQLQELDRFFTIYTTGSFWEITLRRWQDYLQIAFSFIFTLPQIMLLFLLGVLTAKMKWLQYPEEHQTRWKKILLMATLIGVPLNIFYALGAVEQAQTPTATSSFAHMVASSYIPILAGAYIALVALFSTSTIGKRTLTFFASAGKIALTNYITQSIVMSTLLYGYGFALGGELTQFQLLEIAMLIYGAQLMVSHIYLKHFSIGPLEFLWRKLS